MLVQTSILTGFALDWSVARAEGWYDYDKNTECFMEPTKLDMKAFSPSTNIELATTIISRENIKFGYDGSTWYASLEFYDNDIKFNCMVHAYDEDMLVAAMRCYVARKLGNKILIPWI